MKPNLLAYGEIIWDVYADHSVIGGATFNFAAHAARCGANVALISAVGRDQLGNGALGKLAHFGVDGRFVRRVAEPTGQCLVTLDENAVPRYRVLRNTAYDRIVLSADDLADIRQSAFDALCFGTLIQRDAVSRATLRRLVAECRFPNIICDANLRPDCYDAESAAFCLRNATVLKVSAEEEPLLRGMGFYCAVSDSPADIAKAICAAFPQIRVVILTLGKDGAFAYTAGDGRSYRQPAIGDRVVSTVGAGDSFTAAWSAAYLSSKPMEECLLRAAELSGYVVAHLAAVPED